MPYAKSYRRRNYRYNRRRLSNRTVFSKTSAKSQARQIATLRNRLSTVERNNRPETQLHNNSASKEFTNSTFATTNDVWKVSLPGSSMTGQWLRSISLNIRGVVEYSDDYQTDVAVDHQRTCSYRFIVYSRKASGNNTIPISNIIDLSSSGTEYELNAVRPLKKGLTSYAKIYYDKSFTISSQNPIRKFNISLKKLMNLHKETTDTNPRGEIQFAVIASGLHFDTSYHQQIKVSFISTYAYNDVN
uniref:Capsid protein n=1 Tax=ssDNA virus sp. TaxID=2593122 RepID=A0A894JNI5_9VIRU|nr:capsid protein [ssDNA virus sp.]